MNILPAQEIKRRGLAAIDNIISDGPVHIFKNNSPHYVIITEGRYKEFLELEKTSYMERLKLSLQDVEKGNVHHFKNASELLKMIDQ
ncbi:MAG: prevent-host-death protein [Gammaproteobacteria bacterium]|nr:prevent-host-death protein [Gammaproteobacteria bacterium]